jgi:hypothetical protein
VINVPEPTTALIAPAPTAARTIKIPCDNGTDKTLSGLTHAQI